MKRAWLFSSQVLVAVVSWTRILFGAINKEHCQFQGSIPRFLYIFVDITGAVFYFLNHAKGRCLLWRSHVVNLLFYNLPCTIDVQLGYLVIYAFARGQGTYNKRHLCTSHRCPLSLLTNNPSRIPMLSSHQMA